MKRSSFPTRLADARIPQLSAALCDYRNEAGAAESVQRLADRLAGPLTTPAVSPAAASSGWLCGVALAASSAALVLYLASVEPPHPTARAHRVQPSNRTPSAFATGVNADPRELAIEAPGAVLQDVIQRPLWR